MLRLDCPRHHPLWSLQVLCVLKAVHFNLWHFWLVITSVCSQKSTLRTLGLLVGHLTPWRAALVATASSVVAYYEGRRKGNREKTAQSHLGQHKLWKQAAAQTDGSRWMRMQRSKILCKCSLLNFLTYICKNILEPFVRCSLGNNIL